MASCSAQLRRATLSLARFVLYAVVAVTVLTIAVGAQVHAQDITPPSAFDLLSPANGGWCQAACRFDWADATDNVGVAKYSLHVISTLTKENIPPTPSDYTLTTVENLAEGPIYSWFVRACDAVGNCRDSATQSFRVDGTLPVPFELVTPPENGWASLTRAGFEWTASGDAGSGLASYELLVDGAAVQQTILPSRLVLPLVDVFFPATHLGDGAHTWAIRATDVAGNSRTTPSRALRVDSTAPSFQSFMPAPVPGAWLGTASPSFSWIPAVDSGSSVVSQAVAIDTGPTVNANSDFAFDLNGWTTFRVSWTSDMASASASRSNPTAVLQQVVTVPAEPSALITQVRVQPNTGTSNNHASLRISVRSPSDVRAFSRVLFDEVLAEADGWRTVNLDLSSLAGGTYRLILETLFIDDGGAFGNNADSVRFEYVRVAPYRQVISGLATSATTAPAQIPLSHGMHEWRVLATDAAGNVGGSEMYPFGVDTIPPNQFLLSTIGGTADGAIVSNPTPTFCWDVPADGGSGVAGFRLYVDGVLTTDGIPTGSRCATPSAPLTEGAHTWFVEAVDAVGNAASSLQSWTVVYDINPPEPFQLVAPAEGATLAEAQPTFSWSASADQGAGLDHYEVSIDNGAGNLCMTPCIVPALQTIFVPSQDLGIGQHNWSVTAVDKAGKRTQAGPQSFGVAATPTAVRTATRTATATGTSTDTPTRTATPSSTPTVTDTRTPTDTRAPTATTTITSTVTVIPTATGTPVPTLTAAPTASVTSTTTPPPSDTPTATEAPTASPSAVEATTETVGPSRSPTPTATPLPCAGDCNDDGRVTINELILGVNIALGSTDLGSCLYLDTDRNAQISIAEIIGAVNATLNGCTDAPIRVDGDPSDWAGLTPVWAEPPDTTGLMVVSLWITNDAQFFYFLVELSFAPPEPGSYAFLDLDTDLDVDTGCGLVSNDVAVGAELLLVIPLTRGEYTYNALSRCGESPVQLPVPIGASGRFAEMAVRIEDVRTVVGMPGLSGFDVLVGSRHVTMVGHYVIRGDT